MPKGAKMERVTTHELAHKILNTPPTMERQDILVPGICDMVKSSEPVWRELKKGQFESNEHGFVTLRVLDYESDFTHWAGDNVDGIEVFHTTPSGHKTELGGIYKVRPDTGKVLARLSINRKESIGPSDERWDAIVGTIGRAITRCMLEKEQS
jgi:hypothetical protein